MEVGVGIDNQEDNDHYPGDYHDHYPAEIMIIILLIIPSDYHVVDYHDHYPAECHDHQIAKKCTDVRVGIDNLEDNNHYPADNHNHYQK